MRSASLFILTLLLAAANGVAHAKTMAEVLAATTSADWRALDPERTAYLELASGRIVIELAPTFAPQHVANVRALLRQGYFDGQSINRVQENFVVQWSGASDRALTGEARRNLPPEFTRPEKGLHFVALPDPDTYAPQTGFVDGFPAARDPAAGAAWLAHCYGMLGAGRDNAVDSGGGTELYVVIGHAPRQLDRNITLLGRVVSGMELLTALPRGPAPMGFHDKPEQRTPILRMRLASEVAVAERTELEVLRTDTAAFTALIEARRNRTDEWYKVPAGRIDVCNVPLPVRAAPSSGSASLQRGEKSE
jgi:peptidylprolyl isomerase